MSRPQGPGPRGGGRRGVAIFVVFGALGILFLLAIGVATLTRHEGRLTGAFVEGQIAFQLAEAGVEQALFVLKKDLETNRELARAMVSIEPVDLTFPASATSELGALAPPGGGAQVEISARYEPIFEVGDTGRTGNLTIHSQGTYHTPQGLRAVRKVGATFRVVGEDLSPVAPDHGLMIRDRFHHQFFAPSLSLDSRDFVVRGGDLHIENGMSIELVENVINDEFRPMGELGLLDLGYDTWNVFNIFSGGVNFTHSRNMTFGKRNITRKYYDFNGLDDLFGPGPAYTAIEEEYMPQVRRAPLRNAFDDAAINLRTAEEYKRLASTIIEPATNANPDGNPRHNSLFRNVTFQGPLGFRNTTYPRVLPLYGWGDWRRMTGTTVPNPSRDMDTSAAIQMDGVTFVRGDVLLEGYYEGIGTLVVQGTVFIGDTVQGVNPLQTGYHSFMNLVVLEDPLRDGGAQRGRHRTGKVVYRPHHDADWSMGGIPKGRNPKPLLDMAIYAKNGFEVDRTSILDSRFDVEIEFNLVTDFFEWQRLPNDMIINGTDPESLWQTADEARRFGVSPFFVPQISTDMVQWVEETPDPYVAPSEDPLPEPTEVPTGVVGTGGEGLGD